MPLTKSEKRKRAVARRGRYYESAPCRRCGTTKRLTHSASCYRCRLDKARNRPERVASRAGMAARRAEAELLGTLHKAFKNMRKRAEKAGRPFTLTAAAVVDLIANWSGPCPGCGEQMVPKTKHAPSVDRVHNSGGYTPDNVVVLCMTCNASKGVYSSAQLFRLAEYVRLAEAQADFYDPVAI